MLDKILENKLAIFIIAIISLVLSIVIFYFNISLGIAEDITTPCHHSGFLCVLKNFLGDIISYIAGFFMVIFCTCIIFLIPKKVSETFLYYMFTFPLECERKYLVPSFIIFLFLELLAFYLSIFVIPNIGPSDLTLSSEQLTIKVIIVGISMMVLVCTPIYGLCITAHRIFSKKDNADYKHKFDYFHQDKKYKLDSFLKKNKK